LVKIQLLLDRDAKLIKNDNGETPINVLKNHQSTKLQQKVLQQKVLQQKVLQQKVLQQKVLQILEKHFNIISTE
jgi:hypothetical protein